MTFVSPMQDMNNFMKDQIFIQVLMGHSLTSIYDDILDSFIRIKEQINLDHKSLILDSIFLKTTI